MTIGLVKLSFDNNRTLILEDCLSIQDFKRNLVSISYLIKHGLIVQFNSSISIRNKYSFICSGTLLNGLYFLSPMSYDINAIESINDDEHDHLSKKMRVSNETYLWHLWLGHINSNRIQGLVKNGILISLIFEPILVCESYLEGKMIKRPFKAKGNRATVQLELIHTDVSYIYLMCHKSEAFEKFQEFKSGLTKVLKQKNNWVYVSKNFGLTKVVNTCLESLNLT